MPGTIIQTVSPREARWLRVSLRSGHRVVGIVLAIFVLTGLVAWSPQWNIEPGAHSFRNWKA